MSLTDRTVASSCSSSGSHRNGCNPPRAPGLLPNQQTQLRLQSKLSALSFVGRDAELRRLEEIYENTVLKHDEEQQQQQQKKNGIPAEAPAILVSGYSGTGKSALVRHFLNRLESKHHNFNGLHGKFAQSAANKSSPASTATSHPLLGPLADALRDFAYTAKHEEPIKVERLRRRLQDKFTTANQVQLLLSIVPELDVLFPDVDRLSTNRVKTSNTPASTSSSDRSIIGKVGSNMRSANMRSNNGSSSATADSEEILHDHQLQRSTTAADAGASSTSASSVAQQLKYVITTFFQAICTEESPLIVFLDDVQWAPSPCMEFILSVLMPNGSNALLPHCMLIGTFRREVNPHLSQPETDDDDDGYYKYLIPKALQNLPSLEWIHLRNLRLTQTEQFLHHVLEEGDSFKTKTDESANTLKYNDLATFLHAKTGGNTFFLLQALEEMERSSIIWCNNTEDKSAPGWQWDLQRCNGSGQLDGGESSMHALSSNPIDAVKRKIRSRSSELQSILKIAAYTQQSSFDLHTIRYLLWNIPDEDASESTDAHIFRENNIELVLEEGVMHGLLCNSIGASSYRFAHDRVQEAAHHMVAAGEERSMLRYRIGTALYHYIKEWHQQQRGVKNGSSDKNDHGGNKPGFSQLFADDDFMTTQESSRPAFGAYATSFHGDGSSNKDSSTTALLPPPPGWYWFCTADHLNACAEHMKKDHLFLAQLNYHVGKRAASVAALSSASKYFQIASERLIHRARAEHSSPWDRFYDFTLMLFQARVDVEFALGQYKAGHELADEILSHARSLDDTLSTHFEIAMALGRQGRNMDSLQKFRSTLLLLKEYPKRNLAFHALRTWLLIKSHLHIDRVGRVLDLPPMTDSRKILTLKLLVQGAIRCQFCNRPMDFLNLLFRAIRWTLLHGLHEYSGMAFALYGTIQGNTGNQAAAARLGEISQQIYDITNGRSVACWTLLTVTNHIEGYACDAASAMQNYHRGYRLGMEEGDFEAAFISWQSGITLAFMSGYRLPSIIASVASMLETAKLFSIEFTVVTMTITLKFFRREAGELPMDWKEVEDCEKACKTLTSETSAQELFTWLYKMSVNSILCIYSKRYESAHRIMTKFLRLSDHDKSYLTFQHNLYHYGLSCAGMSRISQTKSARKKYKTKLQGVIKELKRTAHQRGMNGYHRCMLLEAELASLSRKSTVADVERSYEVTISVAAAARHINDASLASELAGDQFVRMDQRDLARTYYAQAWVLYEEWGASSRTRCLEESRGEYLDDESIAYAKETLERRKINVRAMGGGLGVMNTTAIDDDVPLMEGTDQSTFVDVSSNRSKNMNMMSNKTAGAEITTKMMSNSFTTPRTSKGKTSLNGSSKKSPSRHRFPGTNGGDDDDDGNISVLSDGSL